MFECEVYCDGSCINNNTYDFRAGGIGIVFTNCRYSDISMTLQQLDDVRPSNQRAELWAMIKSLQLILKDVWKYGDVKFTLYSDSAYAIQCIRQYVPTWVQKFGADPRNWNNSMGRPVANRFLINDASDLYIDIVNLYSSKGWGDFEIFHVRGHNNNEGNERADYLARNAAQKMHSGLLSENANQSSSDDYY